MVTFSALRREDFPLVARWLAEPLVAEWWNHETSPEAIERDFGPAVDGREPTDMCLAHTGGEPLGLIQRYPIAAYPEYVEELAPVLPVPAGALSIDYFVGEPAFRGQGLGTAMIAALLDRSWSRFPDAHDVIVPVHAENRGSWRALERVGFTRVAEGELAPDNPSHSRDHYVYRVSRPA